MLASDSGDPLPPYAESLASKLLHFGEEESHVSGAGVRLIKCLEGLPYDIYFLFRALRDLAPRFNSVF